MARISAFAWTIGIVAMIAGENVPSALPPRNARGRNGARYAVPDGHEGGSGSIWRARAGISANMPPITG
jgi:hypothetical protein